QRRAERPGLPRRGRRPEPRHRPARARPGRRCVVTTTSPVYTTTFETGGCTLVAPGLTVHPDRARLPSDSEGLAGGEVNGPFVADFLSAALTHEQCGRHLYRS